jgi:hypothetical protein
VWLGTLGHWSPVCLSSSDADLSSHMDILEAKDRL